MLNQLALLWLLHGALLGQPTCIQICCCCKKLAMIFKIVIADQYNLIKV